MLLNPEIKEQVQQGICTLEKYQLDKVILLGSRARGDFHRASDMDLAVSGGDLIPF